MGKIMDRIDDLTNYKVDICCDKCNKQIKSIDDDWIMSSKRKVRWCSNCFEEEEHNFPNLNDDDYEEYLDYKKLKEKGE